MIKKDFYFHEQYLYDSLSDILGEDEIEQIIENKINKLLCEEECEIQIKEAEERALKKHIRPRKRYYIKDHLKHINLSGKLAFIKKTNKKTCTQTNSRALREKIYDPLTDDYTTNRSYIKKKCK